MISTVFGPVYSGETIIGQRLTVYFSGQVLHEVDFPVETEMTDTDQYMYVVSKLAPLFA